MNTARTSTASGITRRRRPSRRNVNPADTADVIAEFPLATAADVRLAIEAAIAALPAWKKTPGPERGRVLWRAAEIARRRIDEIARTLTREEGKILKEAKGEVTQGHLAARVLRRRRLPHARQDAAVRIARHLHLHAAPAARRGRADRAVELPVGDPGVEERPGARRRQLPSSSSRRSSRRPPRRCSPRSTKRPGCRRASSTWSSAAAARSARRWSHAPELRAISFTGSNRVGGALYVKAAQRGAKVTCEMGGKNAGDRDARRRPRQGRRRHSRRRVRLHRAALHRHLARHRASRHQAARWSIGSSRSAQKIKVGPGPRRRRPTWARRSTTSSGQR